MSLRTEDVKAQYEALTPETRERLNNVLSQKEVDPNTNVSLAHAHGYLKISRNPLLRVYRDFPVKDEIAHESEIDSSVEPHTTHEHGGISSTRKRRRCYCLKAIYFLSPWKRVVHLVIPSLEDTSTPCLKPMIRRQNRVNKRNFWGCQQWLKCNGTRRPLERGTDEISPA